jgi:hypothetical protein
VPVRPINAGALMHLRLAIPLVLLCSSNAAAQYVVATPQSTMSAPPTYAAPAQYAAPMAAPMVAGPGHFGAFLGHVGRKLESYSWPRVQPMAMAVPMQSQQMVYVVMQPMTQAPPQMQVQYAPAPVGVPQQPTKATPPQAPMQAPPTWPTPQRTSEAAPLPPVIR